MPGINQRGLLATDCEVRAARWVQRKLGTCQHERRVLAIASRLFDLTRPVLKLGMAENRLLRLASLVHDVGRCVSDKNHPHEGALMIMQSTSMSLSPLDRRALCFLTRYHRGAVPPAYKEDYLKPADPRQSLRAVLALLRVADALDSRRVVSPKLTFTLDAGALSIYCQVNDDVRSARRVYGRRKKFRLLESILARPIHIEIIKTDAAQAA
jgi:exopolyphosphatase/pppGpp-phosphohydrolase